MNKLEVQQRVLQNGKPLDLDKFESSTDWNCTFTTGSECTFKTGSECTAEIIQVLSLIEDEVKTEQQSLLVEGILSVAECVYGALRNSSAFRRIFNNLTKNKEL